MKILVADDDPIWGRLVCVTLERNGFQPLLVNDGVEALAVLRREDPPRLALLDWVMPRTDGESFLRARAASESLARIPVFVMSATHSLAGDSRIQGFLPKPFAVEALLPALRAVCDEHCPAPRRAACRHLAPREPGI